MSTQAPDQFNREEISTPFPYDDLDRIEQPPTPMDEAVRMLALIMDYIGGGKTTADKGMRFLVVQYVTRPEVYGFNKLEDLAAHSPNGIKRAAAHRLVQDFERLTGFKSILSSEKMSQAKMQATKNAKPKIKNRI